MALRQKPSRVSSSFNINYYVNSDGQYIGTSGKQRLKGKLTVNSEVVTGEERVYGESYMQDEPTILNISDPTTLNSNNLVSKSYVDYKVIRPSTNPIATTLLTTNQLTDNHLVSKSQANYIAINPTTNPIATALVATNQLTDNHLVSKSQANYIAINPTNEPKIGTPLDTNLLTNTHLTSKLYVDSKITSEININNTARQLFPDNCFMGKAYNPNDAANSLPIVNGIVYIKFKNANQRVYTCCFDIDYYINRSPPNTYLFTWYGNAKGSIYCTAKYLVNFHMNDNGTWSNTSTFYLLTSAGPTLHNNWTFEGNNQTYKMVTFGLENNTPSIHVKFPHQFNNLITTEGWVSNYGCSIKIATSSPMNIYNQNLSTDSPGVAYFSNTP